MSTNIPDGPLAPMGRDGYVQAIEQMARADARAPYRKAMPTNIPDAPLAPMGRDGYVKAIEQMARADARYAYRKALKREAYVCICDMECEHKQLVAAGSLAEAANVQAQIALIRRWMRLNPTTPAEREASAKRARELTRERVRRHRARKATA